MEKLHFSYKIARFHQGTLKRNNLFQKMENNNSILKMYLIPRDSLVKMTAYKFLDLIYKTAISIISIEINKYHLRNPLFDFP